MLKAIIIKRKGLSESESFEHVSAKLFLEAGFSIEDKFENQMVGFLSEIIKWGKYPKRKKGDSGTFLKSTSKFYANETVFFTDSNNFNNLLQFSLKVIEYAEKILLENVAQEDEIYFRETLERLYGLVIANSENIKNKPK
ncbi:hypothetical protein [Leptospira wolffii]|uniref:hypothetical protein n=1 Tax=Leptospira wolffii TaxID=409998 RepID=UPI001E29B8BF|nr:hypothetical protein [Leptospira wolffii]